PRAPRHRAAGTARRRPRRGRRSGRGVSGRSGRRAVDIRLRSAAREHAIRLVPEDGGFAATVDGEAHRVAWVASGRRTAAPGGTTVEEHAFEVGGRVVRAVVARARDRVLVALAGRVYVFESGEEARQAAAGVGSGTVVAPMPGKVLAVLVAPGERVAIGQPGVG